MNLAVQTGPLCIYREVGFLNRLRIFKEACGGHREGSQTWIISNFVKEEFHQNAVLRMDVKEARAE